jgi:hypothetical protein
MPLLRGKRNRKANFRELGKGKTYRRTKKKYGTKRANKQRVAIVLSNERRSKRRSGR